MKRFQLIFFKLLPYIVGSSLILCVMIFGSRVEVEKAGTPIAANFSNIDFKITADQVSETYTVASIADTLELASASSVSENYISVINRYE